MQNSELSANSLNSMFFFSKQPTERNGAAYFPLTKENFAQVSSNGLDWICYWYCMRQYAKRAATGASNVDTYVRGIRMRDHRTLS